MMTPSQRMRRPISPPAAFRRTTGSRGHGRRRTAPEGLHAPATRRAAGGSWAFGTAASAMPVTDCGRVGPSCGQPTGRGASSRVRPACRSSDGGNRRRTAGTPRRPHRTARGRQRDTTRAEVLRPGRPWPRPPPWSCRRRLEPDPRPRPPRWRTRPASRPTRRGAQTLNDAGNPIALSSPNVADLDGQPSVVVGDRAGYVYAYHLADGTGVGRLALQRRRARRLLALGGPDRRQRARHRLRRQRQRLVADHGRLPGHRARTGGTSGSSRRPTPAPTRRPTRASPPR